MMRADPTVLIRHYACPLLIAQGDQDLQVSIDDAMRLHQAAPQAHIAVLPGVNHVLKTVLPGDHAANLASYADPARPIAHSLVQAIAHFVKTTHPSHST